MKDSLTYRFMYFTTLIIVGIMAINFTWEYQMQKRDAMEEMKEKAQVITKQLVATREFIAKNQDRINYDSQGNFEFKHLNPAAVGMGVGEIFGQLTDYRIKQTRIGSRDPRNAPDAYEIEMLKQFGSNKELNEIWTTDEVDGKFVFRYMIPLRIEAECLVCHGEPAGEPDITGYKKEGYKIGDVGGAISLIMPMDIFLENIETSVMRHLIFILVLMATTITLMYLLVTRLVLKSLGKLQTAVAEIGEGNLEVDLSEIDAQGEIQSLADSFQRMAVQLRDLYNHLEEKVEQRTLELEKANLELEKTNLELEQANLELEKANRELEQANIKLNEINRYKSDFLAIMSHELRTPLTSIIAFTELLLQDLPQEFELERQNLHEIRSSSEHLLRLINNILDLAKIEAGRQKLCLEIVDVVDVIGKVESTMASLAKKKDIVFTTEIARGIPLVVADPEKIRRVIENLVGNAIKFTPEGGKVAIHAKYNPESDEVEISVTDNGIGIRAEEQELIFERFTQIDSSNSRRYGGTGLGLALAKELVDLHGGNITVESEPQKGSTFTVTLPLNPPDQEKEES